MKQFILFIIVVVATSLHAEDEWGDDWGEASPYEALLEMSYGYAQLINEDAVNLKSSLMNELRYQAQLDYQKDQYKVHADTRLLLDAQTDDYQLVLRELNLAFPLTSKTDIKLGRQIITWGTGDMLFLNDLFPKDWQSFFNGREDADLKLFSEALRISHYGDWVNIDLVVQPKFVADATFTGERYSFYLPNLGLVQPSPELELDQPKQSEVAVRLFTNKNGNEWALYANNGYFKSPSKMNAAGDLGYAKLQSVGASLRRSMLGGVASFETVYYKSKEDNIGDNPWINNSQSRWLIGYETELVANWTLASQLYAEITHNYQALKANAFNGQLIPDETRTMLTFRLTQLANQQRLINSWMLFYSPSDQDYYLRYSSQFKLSDQWRISVGVNWLNGNYQHTFLSQLQDNSNVFFRVNYNFD